MSDIMLIIPRPTRVTLGGRPFLASELRLGDLADLAGHVRARIPGPYDVAEPFLAAADSGRAWKQLLADTIEAQESWPPDLASDEATACLWDDAGRAFFAWVVLRREHPESTPASAAEILAHATVAEYARLARVAWAADPMGIMARMVDGPGGPPGDPRDWTRCWYEYATKCRNGPGFADLSLTQLNAFMGEGELPDAAATFGPAATFDRERAIRREDFWREIDDPGGGD